MLFASAGSFASPKRRVQSMFPIKLKTVARSIVPICMLIAGIGVSVPRGSAQEAIGKQVTEDQKTPRLDLYGSPLPEGAMARMGSSLLRHENAQVSFTRDGKMLITLGSDRTVRYWEVATGQWVRQSRFPPRDPASDRQFSATLAPNGELCAVAEKDSVTIYETATAKPQRQLAVKDAETSR